MAPVFPYMGMARRDFELFLSCLRPRLLRQPSSRSMTDFSRPPATLDAATCRSCGACCSYSPEWPRFSLEDETALDLIPREFVDDKQGRMRCDGNRCTALVGDVGVATACAVYAVRPDVCRACLPGDAACQTARHRFNL